MRIEKIILPVLFNALLLFHFTAYSGNNLNGKLKEQALHSLQDQPVYFFENKGQMTDENNNPVPSVLIKASDPCMNVFVTEKGLTYVFVKSEEKFERKSGLESKGEKEEIFEIEKAWINLHLEGATIKKENVVKETDSREHFNYFYPHCADGIYGVKGYQRLTIKNIYPGIDWVLYVNSKTGMKYDFVVHPGADPNQIKLVYESAKPLTINTQGDIQIETPLGVLTESAPVSFIKETNESVESSYSSKVIDKNNVEVTFNISTPVNSTLIIDPQQVWGTLFSGTSDQGGATSMEVDNNNNLFIVGYQT